MSEAACPVCGAEMAPRLEPWLRRCPECGLWTSTTAPRDGAFNPQSTLIEDRRELGLKPLRLANFRRLLDLLERKAPLRGLRILDVGCAYGWFLEAAAARGMAAVGIEPEEEVAAKGRRAGLDIRGGLFPDCMGPAERFDVVVFNDVLEHLPDVGRIFDSCRAILNPGGRLVINIPDSRGFFYGVACLAARLGFKRSIRRLWQQDFRSPHLCYFNADNLGRFASRHGLKLAHSGPLPSLTLQGFWTRLRMDSKASLVGAMFTWLAIAAAYPAVRYLLHSDAMLQVYER